MYDEQLIMRDLRADFSAACLNRFSYFEESLLDIAIKALGPDYAVKAPYLSDWLVAAFKRLVRLGKLEMRARTSLESINAYIFRKSLGYVIDRVTGKERGEWKFVHRMSSSLMGGRLIARPSESMTDDLALVRALDAYEEQNPELCELIDMHFWLGHTLEEIGDKFGWSTGKVDGKLRKALGEIETILLKSGFKPVKPD